MDKYIQALLALNQSVILPEFGALSITNEETGEAMFNAYLKFNDGKLEKYIAEQEGIEKQDAANMVAKYVRDLELLLNKGETYDIFQFGRFIKREDGSFDFENWDKFSEEGSSTYSAPKIETDNTEATEVEKEIDSEEENVTPAEVKKEEITEEEISSIKEVYEKPAERTLPEEDKKQSLNKFVPSQATNTTTESSTPASNETVEVIEEKQQLKAKKTPKTPKEKTPQTKKKRSVFFFPVIILVLILGGAGVFVGMFPDEAKKLVGWEDIASNSPEKEELNDADQTLVDNIDMEDDIDENMDTEYFDEDEVTNDIIEGFVDNEAVEQIAKDEPIQVPNKTVATTSDGNFHIIVGSFGERQNAENLMNSLQAKGHAAQIVGPVNNLHMVSFGAYSSRNAAQENLQQAINETGGGWILKR